MHFKNDRFRDSVGLGGLARAWEMTRSSPKASLNLCPADCLRARVLIHWLHDDDDDDEVTDDDDTDDHDTDDDDDDDEVLRMRRMTTTQRHNYLKATVALALYREYGRVPQETEIEHVYHVTCVVYSTITMLGSHTLWRHQQKQSGQAGLV